MERENPGETVWTRRQFLAAAAVTPTVLGAASGDGFEADRKRFLDPATEFEVVRLTDSAYTSYLPPAYGRPLSKKGVTLVYCCDRAGTMQAFRMEIKTGVSKQLTNAKAIDPVSLNLLPDDRGICYFDEGTLFSLPFHTLKPRAVYESPEGWQHMGGFSVAEDGMYAAVVEKLGQFFRALGRVLVHAVDDPGFGDDVFDRHARIQARVRILEDDLHLAPERPHIARRERHEVTAVVHDASEGRLHEAEDETTERALATAALADESHRLAAPDSNRNAVDSTEEFLAARKEASTHGKILADPFGGDERARAIEARRLGAARHERGVALGRLGVGLLAPEFRTPLSLRSLVELGHLTLS